MKKEFLAAGFWLLFSAYTSLEALRLGLGNGNKPGPGFFPFGAAIAIGIIALSRLLRARGETPSTNMAGGSATNETNKILWVVGGLLAYALFLESLGFLLCTFILNALFLKAVAGRSWLTTLSFALSVALAAHLIFNVALRAQLPSGILTF
jgi:tripartite tricarboxylate transporter TctB family protein